MKRIPKTPIEFDYDLWTTEDGKCMVRVKLTGEVIYIRLSLADEDTGCTKDESDSIGNQRMLINRFLDEHPELAKCPRLEFADDGYTGTNFQRPHFTEMMENVRAGEINLIGHTIHYRETNISFKNKRRIRKPQSEWVRVENTQEPIISEQVFRQVQEQIASRRRERKNGTTQIFAGLIKCADCGWSLAYGENRQNSKPYGYYHCSKNGQGTRQCSMHYIRYDVLYAYVLSRLQYWSGLVQHDEEQLLKRLLNANDKGQTAARKKQAAELKKAKKRKAEVDTLFARMYEDWAAGRITEYNFNMLSGKYQSEQAELEEKIEQLQSAIAAESQSAADAEKWIALMKECVNPTELTAELLNTLIEKILVHEAVKNEDGSREQEVEIFYRFIGKID